MTTVPSFSSADPRARQVHREKCQLFVASSPIFSLPCEASVRIGPYDDGQAKPVIRRQLHGAMAGRRRASGTSVTMRHTGRPTHSFAQFLKHEPGKCRWLQLRWEGDSLSPSQADPIAFNPNLTFLYRQTATLWSPCQPDLEDNNSHSIKQCERLLNLYISTYLIAYWPSSSLNVCKQVTETAGQADTNTHFCQKTIVSHTKPNSVPTLKGGKPRAGKYSQACAIQRQCDVTVPHNFNVLSSLRRSCVTPST